MLLVSVVAHYSCLVTGAMLRILAQIVLFPRALCGCGTHGCCYCLRALGLTDWVGFRLAGRGSEMADCAGADACDAKGRSDDLATADEASGDMRGRVTGVRAVCHTV